METSIENINKSNHHAKAWSTVDGVTLTGIGRSKKEAKKFVTLGFLFMLKTCGGRVLGKIPEDMRRHIR